MKIVMDGQPTVIQKSGFGHYIVNLVKHLNAFDEDINIALVSPDDKTDLSTPKRIIWDQWSFPKKAKMEKPDIIHKPCFSAPIFKNGPTIVTAHDLIPLIFPKNLSFFSRFFYNKVMPFSFRFVDAIITDSEHSKKDLIKYLKIKSNKITVIPLAAGDNYQQVKDKLKIKKVMKKYGIKKNYILSVSTIEPRKNVPFLIKTFAEVVKMNPELDFQLVLTGKKGWGLEAINQIISEEKIEDKVVFTGYVEDVDMATIYSGATLFAFPSIYEGFGLTPLEAMACGVAVICSNASSLPEVCGDAAIMLDPNNMTDWRENIASMLTDSDLRKRYSQKSLKRSSLFSWEKTAKETLEVYKRVLKK